MHRSLKKKAHPLLKTFRDFDERPFVAVWRGASLILPRW